MNEEITTTAVNINNEGNQIIAETTDGAGKTQTIKYGLIRLMGEKQARRVSYKTIVDINNAKNAKFAGQINIPEINMSIQIGQIVMMRSETETIRINENITKLPTANICLDLDFIISPHIRPWFIGNRTPYYEANAHYVERDGERQYYLEFDKIKRLLKINFDSDGYDYIAEIYEYGVRK